MGESQLEKTGKASLRAVSLTARDALGEAMRAEKSAAICRAGSVALAVSSGQTVSGYYPIRSEVDAMPLLAALGKGGARLCLPAVLDRETIVFRQWNPVDPLVDVGWGTMGAPAEAPVVDPDLILMPLAAFDRQGNRIGYGAGHYDRAIDRMRQKGLNPRLIGIAFDCQEVAEVPAGPYDIPMNGVLTESGLVWFD